MSARIVTADAKCLQVSATSHPDLFWALRGGGGNFGVVTEFEFALHPVGPEVFTGLHVFPRAEAGTVLRKYRKFVATAPDELSVWIVLRQAPPLPFLPPQAHGQEVLVLALCYVGSEESGRKLTAPLAELGTVLANNCPMNNLMTVVTRFQLPAGVTADQIRAGFDEVAPRFRNVPGLVRKQFLRSKDCRTAGGVYLWNDEGAARVFMNERVAPMIRTRTALLCCHFLIAAH